ncbi:MAG: sulfurtransferase [Chloroflexota bacterium]
MQTYTTLISTNALADLLASSNGNVAVVDCRFALDDTAQGRQHYLAGHIPGAVYAHLDEDLSGPIITGETGRHPLPSVEAFVETLSSWGIDSHTQVVAYDSAGGLYAGRLWWMLRWLGHDAVALLDGDWRQWVKEERPTVAGEETRTASTFVAQVREEMVASVDDVIANLETNAYQLFDARDEGRFRGEPSPRDPVSGHIPGAKSAFFAHNLTSDGHWQSADALKARFDTLLDGQSTDETIFYCGSGVSAAHNLLALEHIGYTGAKLYVGSWSDWINDRSRPVEKSVGV